MEAFNWAKVDCASATKITVRKRCMVTTVWSGKGKRDAEREKESPMTIDEAEKNMTGPALVGV